MLGGDPKSFKVSMTGERRKDKPSKNATNNDYI